VTVECQECGDELLEAWLDGWIQMERKHVKICGPCFLGHFADAADKAFPSPAMDTEATRKSQVHGALKMLEVMDVARSGFVAMYEALNRPWKGE
jgi:hypothetical protein